MDYHFRNIPEHLWPRVKAFVAVRKHFSIRQMIINALVEYLGKYENKI